MEHNDAKNGRVLLLKRNEKILTLLYSGNRLLYADAYAPEESVLHNIYIGKVKNVVHNIQAAFVEYKPGALCFLPLRECQSPILVNRGYDGRIIAGDEIVLQIISERQKNKEAGATANLSFAGKYLVLSLCRRQTEYSSQLSKEQKSRLQAFAENNAFFAETESGYGIVFRTNAGTLTDLALLEEELSILRREADSLLQRAPCRTCFSLLKQAPAAYLENLQNFRSGEYDRITTDDAVLFQETEQYLRQYQPYDLDKLVFYEDRILPLCKLYSVEARLEEALQRKVWMKSGGYLVIDHTEALTCIDVNSGKYAGRKEREETFLSLNLEAAEEIGRQLRLRNISGIVIIDFINMNGKGQDRLLFSRLKEILSRDPVYTSAVDMTALGLVEVTRKKERKSLWEQLR